MSIEALRTPDDRFENLPGYAFEPNYIEDLPGYEGLRMHYLDEGPKDADHVFLCLHGEPSWAYLYRKMIPVFTAAGHRAIAPDFFGFGRSDKPIKDEVYTFHFHRNALLAFIDRLGLKQITLVCQDWGGILGLTLPLDRPELIQRLLVMNTGIPDGSRSPSKGWDAWRAYCKANPDLKIGKMMGSGDPQLTEDEKAAYDAPFPDINYKAGVRAFPEIVPITKDMDGADLGRAAIDWWKTEWSGPTFMAVGLQDPVLGKKVMDHLRTIIRGCPEPMEIEDGGHFVQERGDRIAKAALEAWG